MMRDPTWTVGGWNPLAQATLLASPFVSSGSELDAYFRVEYGKPYHLIFSKFPQGNSVAVAKALYPWATGKDMWSSDAP